MTSLNVSLPNCCYQKQVSQDGSASAAASASAGENGASAAAAAASASSSSSSGAEGFNSLQDAISKLDQAAQPQKKCHHKDHKNHKKPEQNQQQPQQNQMMAMFIQMMMMLMQMMMKMLGMKDQNQQQNQQQPQNSQNQPFQFIPQQNQNTPQAIQQPANNQPAFTPAQNPVQYNAPAPQQQVIKPQYINRQPQNSVVPNNQPRVISQPVQQTASPASAASAAAATKPESAQAASAASSTASNQSVPTVVEDKSASSSSAAASASAEKTVSFGDSGKGTPISEIPQNELDAVKGQDLNAKNANGKPKFVVYDGHLYASKIGNIYKSVSRLPAGKNNLYLSNNAKIEEGGKGGYEVTAKASGAASGSAASDENSASSAAAAAASADIDVKETEGTVSTVTSKERTSSPLILDANGDGKVSAKQGKGVDLNGDGKADGAATNGDKMLSMGDVDGDGEITGKEVFGDKTVDPFTGKDLKAKNGFEALKEVAKSAEKHTGIKCMDDEGNVDLKKLKAALEKSGKGSLGTISDDNNKNLESLGDAASVNVNNYQNTKESGDVQHNQKGSYTTNSGDQKKVDDVWFKLS